MTTDLKSGAAHLVVGRARGGAFDHARAPRGGAPETARGEKSWGVRRTVKAGKAPFPFLAISRRLAQKKNRENLRGRPGVGGRVS